MRALVVQHSAGDGPGLLADWLAARGVELDVRRAFAGEPVPERPAADLLVVLGGPMGAGDDAVAPWLPATRRLLAAAVRERVPTLGVCLGAQLLAVACGGTVSRGAAGPEIGVHQVELTPEAVTDPLLTGCPRRLPAVQWHWDAVVELPPGAALLAASAAYPHQAFRVGPCAWGLQWHPEVTPGTATAWARDDADAVRAAGVDPAAAAAGVEAAYDGLRAAWRPVVERFAALPTRLASGVADP